MVRRVVLHGITGNDDDRAWYRVVVSLDAGLLPIDWASLQGCLWVSTGGIDVNGRLFRQRPGSGYR